MKRKTKGGIILTSLAAIAVATSLLAGSTYALFTSESKTNIAVTSGKVEVSAEVDELVTYTGKDLTGVVADDEAKIKESTNFTGLTNGEFMNGGTAVYDKTTGELKLENMTPGDKVTFKIKVTNKSNVKAKYSTVISAKEDDDLFDGLEVIIDGTAYKDKNTEVATPYFNLLPSEDPTDITVSISLPSDRGNAYQDKKCTIVSTVKAIQSNARVGESVVSTKDSLKSALTSTTETSVNASLTENLTLDNGEYFSITKDTVIYGNGKSLYADEKKATSGVAGRVIDVNEVNNITITLVDLNIVGPTCNEGNRGISIYNSKNVKVVLDNCTVSANHYALNIASGNDNFEIVAKNTTFVGYTAFQTWSNNTKATFENCTLKGVNQWTQPSGVNKDENDCSTITVNSTSTGNKFVFNDCTIEALEEGNTSEGTPALEYFIGINKDEKDKYGSISSLSFKGCTFKHNNSIVPINSFNDLLSIENHYYCGPSPESITLE